MAYTDVPAGFAQPMSDRIVAARRTFTAGMATYEKGMPLRADHPIVVRYPHRFKEINPKKVVKAREFFALAGGRRTFARGDLLRADHPLVAKNPWLFQPLVDPEPEPEQLETPEPSKVVTSADRKSLFARIAGRS